MVIELPGRNKHMRTVDFRTKHVVALAFAALLTVAAMSIHSAAQLTNLARNTTPTNAMARYYEAVRESLVSGTSATNLTEAEVNRLMNDSIKTNLAAQLWFRHAMGGRLSAGGAKMAQDLRVLESLRAGRTEEAIRRLEAALDDDILFLANHFKAVDQFKDYKPTAQPLTALQWAREYRLKFPYESEDPAIGERVRQELSHVAGGTPANETNVAQMPVLSDEAQLLSREQATEISKLLEAHNAHGPGRIYVVIIKQLPPGVTIEQYALKKINERPRGNNEKADRVLVAIAVDDRKLRIETSKEVRELLPNAFCKNVIDDTITPRFKQEKYYEGLHAGISALSARLRQ
jgi:hypothetical protein